jgi:hypothetical protein
MTDTRADMALRLVVGTLHKDNKMSNVSQSILNSKEYAEGKLYGLNYLKNKEMHWINPYEELGANDVRRTSWLLGFYDTSVQHKKQKAK